MNEECGWKQELIKKRIKNEREKNVETTWNKIIANNGEGAPEWLKEAAMKKKLKQQKSEQKDEGCPPWFKEVMSKNVNLARKLSASIASEVDD